MSLPGELTVPCLEDPSTPITCFALLERALSGDVSFLPDVRFKAKLRWCCASAVIVDRNLTAYCIGEAIIVGDILVARRSFSRTPLVYL